MVELLRTNDIVLIGLLEALMRDERIPFFVADRHISGLEGSIGAFPRRLLVPSDHAGRARRFLTEAGFGAELRDG